MEENKLNQMKEYLRLKKSQRENKCNEIVEEAYNEVIQNQKSNDFEER